MNDIEFEGHLQRTSTYQRSFHFIEPCRHAVFSISSICAIISINQFRRIGLNLASIIFFLSFANLFFSLISAQVSYNLQLHMYPLTN